MHRGRFPGDNFSVSRRGRQSKRKVMKQKQLLIVASAPAHVPALYPIDSTGARIQEKSKKTEGNSKK
jgi:hypothetical protein